MSDDEDDLHPNIDRESWFRMKHRSRVEREENEEKDKANIRKEVSRFCCINGYLSPAMKTSSRHVQIIIDGKSDTTNSNIATRIE